MDDEEQVLGIEVDLRALPPLGAVLDRELVQRERVLEGAKLLVRGSTTSTQTRPWRPAPATISASNGASSRSAPSRYRRHVITAASPTQPPRRTCHDCPMAALEPVPELEALLELWRAHDAAFERAEPAWWGAVVSDRRYPAIHEANYARVEARSPVPLAEIAVGLGTAGADPRTHVVVFHPEEQTDLLAEAGTAGARLVWDLVMVRRSGHRSPGRGPTSRQRRSRGSTMP